MAFDNVDEEIHEKVKMWLAINAHLLINNMIIYWALLVWWSFIRPAPNVKVRVVLNLF